jgi:hypothetical protein
MRTSSITRPVVLAVLLFLPHFLHSQAGLGVTDTVQITSTELAHFCGISPQYITQSNLIAHGEGPGSDEEILGGNIYNDPCSINPSCIRISGGGSGRIRVFFEDINSNTNDGFADLTWGPARISTMMAVCDYVENVIDLSNLPTGEFMDIYMERSFAFPNNPATNQGFLAIAGPYYSPGTWGVTQGFYDGHVSTHVIQGFDPEFCQYDGHILVNFHGFLSPQNTFVPINYWDDYLNTTQTCRIDLFTVLLHELTHTMGWLSAVIEDPNNLTAQCGNNANSYSRYDNLFNFYYDQTSGNFTQVVDPSGPTINAGMTAFTNPLRSNTIWLNQQGPPDNQPVYSGVLDPNTYPFLAGSAMSHLNANLLSFTGMSQLSPGYQPNYVMGPSIGRAQRKREWTIPEIRTLLLLGYGLGNFGGQATLNPFDNTDVNSGIILNNTPAFRSNSWIPSLMQQTPMLAYNTPFNFMELMQTDHVMVNANIPNQAPTSTWSTTIAALSNVADNQGNVLRIMPNSLFGIRGVSDGGNQAGANNHNCIVETGVTQNGSTGFIYTPLPGFHGRAQFGFYLWDGHERGALRIVTIDVTPNSNFTVVPGNQLVVYPDLEDGTEVRQRIQNPNFENSQLVDWQYEGVFAGQNFSGGHYFNYASNWWNLAGGDVTSNTWYGCFMGPTIPANGDYGMPGSDQNQTFGGFLYPTQVATPGTNERYHHFNGGFNYSTLINEVSNCNIYRYECDLNFENTGYSVGQTFQFQLQFVDNPFPALHSQLFYTAPVQVLITTVAPNTWQHVTFDFQYCGTSTYFMNLIAQGIVVPSVVITGTGNSNGPGGSGPPLTNTFTSSWTGVFIDNISLIEINPTPPPLTVTVVANPTTVCNGAASTLTASSAPYLPCNAAYTWQPAVNSMNQVNTIVQTNPVTVPTTYTATLTYACNQVVTGTVTVTPSPLPVITPMGPYCNNDNIGHLLVANPTGGTWSGPGVSSSFSGSFFTPFSAGTGTHLITYTFIPFAGCTTVVTTTIVVNPAPVITFGTNGPYCSTCPYQNLVAQPTLGTWSGTGIVGNQFDPSVGPGNYVLTYTFTSGACTTSATTTVTVTPPPTVTITPVGPLCQFDAPVPLVVSMGTGTFSGTGVTGNQFDPVLSGVGSFVVTFNGTIGCCAVTATITIIVLPGNMPNTWPKFISGNGRSNVRGVVTDGAGNVYITGEFGGAASSTFPTYGAITPVGQKDLFVIKYNEQCGSVWMRTVALSGAIIIGYDITLDANGDVYVTGSFQGTLINFGNNTFMSSPVGKTEAFLLKLNKTTGATIFAKQSFSPSTPSSSVGKAVHYSAANNAIYIEGEFTNTIKFGTLANLVTVGGTDVFVARYSTSGVEAWSAKIGSPYATEPDLAGSLGSDVSGNLYVGTSVSGAVVSPSPFANTNGSTNIFIAKYNSANTYIGGVTAGGTTTSDDIYLKDMVVDNTGRCYFTGSFKGTVVLNASLSAATQAIYTGWVSSALSFTSTWSIKSADVAGIDDSGNSIALNGTNLFVTGTTNPGSGTFPGFTPTTVPGPSTSKEIFTYKISTAGVPSFLEYSMSNPNAANYGYCVAVNNSSGSIFSGGGLGIGTAATTVTFNTALNPLTAEQGVVTRSNQSGTFFRTGEFDSEGPQDANADSLLSIQLYPNPNTGDFTLFFSEGIPSNCLIRVSDISGRKLMADQFTCEFNAGSSAHISLKDVPNGLYLVEILSDKQTEYRKVIVNR